MKVNCPLPLPSPWSPVGYRVVEVADEHGPVCQPHPSTAPPREQPDVPRAPLVVQAVPVAEETVPKRPPLPRYPRIYAGQWSPKRYNSPLPWGAVAFIGFVLVVAVAVLVAASADRRSVP